MARTIPPHGRLRVAAGALHDVASMAASAVPGVLSAESLVAGAAVGGAIGGTVGLLYGGPAGGVAGVSLGTAVGAAATAVASRAGRPVLVDVDGLTAPDLQVDVVARYGQNLVVLADDVRDAIHVALRDRLGLEPGRVAVDVVDVVSPELELPIRLDPRLSL